MPGRPSGDYEENEFQRTLPGALIPADGRLKFFAQSGAGGWEIAVADVRRVGVSEAYGKASSAIVIESRT